MKKILILILFICMTIPQLFAQSKTVTGKVLDTKGDGIVGATVKEKGTGNASITDVNGNFKIKLSGTNSRLVISFIGDVSNEVVVGNQTNISVTLESDITQMQEVVVVGYGTQKKASVVGAISTVKATELQQSSTPNLSNALAGRVAGVITIMGSGKPGNDNAQIFIRGQATTNTTDPLVLVDGLERDWQEIDPTDIETFSVLKDASATAVFGVRGANGVILITTKRGMKGKPVLTLSTQSAIQQPIQEPKYLRSFDYATLMNEALHNDGQAPAYSASDLLHYKLKDSPYTHPDNNYYQDFIKPASWQQMTNLSASGGTDFLNYYISANYLHQEGLYKDFSNSKYSTNTDYDRYNFRSNLDFKVNKTLKISVDLTGRLEVRRQPNFSADAFSKLCRLPPNFENYLNPNGSMGGMSDETRLAPYALISSYGDQVNNTNVLEGSIKIDQNLNFITKGLSIRAMTGFNSSYKSYKDIVEKPELWTYTKFGQYVINQNRVALSISNGKGPADRRVSFEGSLNYDRSLGDHTFTGMLLYQQSQYIYEANVPTGYLGWVGRGTYSYKLRYMLEVDAGYNGSNQFSAAHRYGFFPAVSLGWMASEEAFWKRNIKFIDYLKIRGSYGEIGNDKIGNFSYIYTQKYVNSPSQVLWGESAQGETGLIEGQPGNLNVTWERAKKSNIGFDVKLFKSRLTATADFFYEKRTDILAVPYTVPLVLGMNNPQSSTRSDGQGLPPANIGIVTNKGLDMEIGYADHIGAVGYFIKGNLTIAHNIINKISEEGKKYVWQKQEGKPIGQHFGLTDIGLFQNSDFVQDASGNLVMTGGFPTLKPGVPVPSFGAVYPGDCKYKDLNADGIIDNYDIGAIGKSGVPTYIYGVSLGGSFNNFDLTVLFQGAGGNTRDFVNDAIWEFNQGGTVMTQHLGRYNPADPTTWTTATYPLLHAVASTNNQQSTTRWTFSGNYLRLKNAEIGYTIPKSLLSHIRISSCRVFVNGTNLITWDKMMNWDPETTNNDGSSYLQLRTWNFGVKVTF